MDSLRELPTKESLSSNNPGSVKRQTHNLLSIFCSRCHEDPVIIKPTRESERVEVKGEIHEDAPWTTLAVGSGGNYAKTSKA